MRLAARRSDLIESVILMETFAQPEPTQAKYVFLNTDVKFFGVNPAANAVMKIMFGDTFLNDFTRKSDREEWKNELNKNNKSIVRSVNGIISKSGVENELANIE
jgi:hypothetical protein